MHHRLLSHPSKRDSFNEPLAHAMKAFRDEPLARIFFWQIANFILFPLNPQTHSTLTRFMDPPRVSSNIQYSSKSILCRQECRNCFKVQSRASHKNWNSLVQTIFIARISEALNKSKINSLNILQTFVIFLSDDQKKNWIRSIKGRAWICFMFDDERGWAGGMSLTKSGDIISTFDPISVHQSINRFHNRKQQKFGSKSINFNDYKIEARVFLPATR